MFFGDSILNAMFGSDATQHAEPGSYPTYIRKLNMFFVFVLRGYFSVFRVYCV